MSFVLVPLTVMTESSWSSIFAKWHDSVNTGFCFLSQSCLQIMYFEVTHTHTHTYMFTCFLESTSASVTHPANEECGEELVIRACRGTAWPSEYWPELGQRGTSSYLRDVALLNIVSHTDSDDMSMMSPGPINGSEAPNRGTNRS